MELEFKPDFTAVQARWDAFWRGERLARPMVSITAPKPGRQPAEKPPYTSGAEGDFQPVIDQLLAWADSCLFLGDALPFFYLEFGPDHFSSFLGADLKFHADSPGTSWAVPFVRDWDDAEIRFRPESFWWRRTVEFIRALRARCDGKLLLAAPTLVAGLDCLAAIRGVENLLLDLAACPEKIHAALKAVCRAYDKILAALASELDYARCGSINRHGMYCRGKIAVPQCDFSCMISPAMFAEFELPCLRHEAAALDAVEYHLDGPGALRHLPALCALEGLDVIQWVPGAGEADERDWSDLYRRIDALGKGQILSCSQEQFRAFAREFRSPQLFLKTSASSRDEALRYLDSLK